MRQRLVRQPSFIANIFLAGLVFLVLGFFLATVHVPRAASQTFANHNVAGWAWSSNVGWISLSCDNTGTCGSVDYGLDFIDVGGGVLDLRGFAWSDNIGWINFDPLGPYPTVANATSSDVRADRATGQLSGWARACNAMPDPACNSPGDQGDQNYGWILFQGVNTGDNQPYGASVDVNSDQFGGWAWGGGPTDSAVIGWISFDCNDWGITVPSQDCAQVEPGVFNSLPEVRTPAVAEPTALAYCDAHNDQLGNPKPQSIFSWSYFDAEGDAQQGSTFQISLDPSFPDPIAFPGQTFEQVVLGSGNTVARPVEVNGDLAIGSLDYGDNTTGRTYYWRVRVTSADGSQSDWIEGPSLTTPSHPFPKSDFSWDPTVPRIDQETGFVSVDFVNLSQSFYPANSALGFFWGVTPGPPAIDPIADPSAQDITVVFRQTDDFNAALTVTDASGQTFNGGPYQCLRTKVVSVKESLPKYIESIPR